MEAGREDKAVDNSHIVDADGKCVGGRGCRYRRPSIEDEIEEVTSEQ